MIQRHAPAQTVCVCYGNKACCWCSSFRSIDSNWRSFGSHYDQMRPRYGNRILVVYKDTDSLLYRVETNDLYEDMAQFKHLLDLLDYPSDHVLYDPSNKKFPLTMTDELNGHVLKECVLLRSEMYSFNYVDGVKQIAKGVQCSSKKISITINTAVVFLRSQFTGTYDADTRREPPDLYDKQSSP